MRVLVVHNFYRSTSPSGEETVVRGDLDRLRTEGVEVETYFRNSDEIEVWSRLRYLQLAIRPTISAGDMIRFHRVMRRIRPEIVHFHNVYPLISPACIWVARIHGARILQTVHNFRHECIIGTRFRRGEICNKCVGRTFPWPGIRFRCYRNSFLASMAMAFSLRFHRRTWRLVSMFLVVQPRLREELLRLGIPEDRIQVRGNNVHIGHVQSTPNGSHVLYAGRLTVEKGVRKLLEAWALPWPKQGRKLLIAGDGPLRDEVVELAEEDQSISYLGKLSRSELGEIYGKAALVVIPSIWLEGSPLTVLEAMSCGRPVVVSDFVAESFKDISDFGWRVDCSKPAQIAQVLREALSDPDLLKAKGRRAHEISQARESRTDQSSLTEIYSRVLNSST